MRFTSVRLTTGPRLHYVEQGDPRGEAIVFLHGWPDSWFSFSRVLPLLSGHYRVLAIDQRGFGDSDRPESGYAIPDLAADVVAFLDALAIERATLVGHSFGSFVARCAAIAQPERITRSGVDRHRLHGVQSGHAGITGSPARASGSDPGRVRARVPGEHRISAAADRNFSHALSRRV